MSTHAAWRRIRSTPVDPDTGCWIWTGATSVGYGRIRVDGRLDMAHRVSYQLFVGQIPEGLDLDHLCMNRRCCNPSHLEPVTRAENMRRAAAAKVAQLDLPGVGAQDAANQLGVERNHVYRLARLGLLDRLAVEGHWRVTPESIERYRADRRIKAVAA